MADVGDSALLEMTKGEDFVAQFYFSGDDDQPIPVDAPIRMQVRDGSGQLVLDFRPDTDYVNYPHITFAGQSGFVQVSCPRTVINEMVSGRYLFDMFGRVLDAASVWSDGQQVKMLSGYVDVTDRVTVMESPSDTPSSGGDVDGGSA